MLPVSGADLLVEGLQRLELDWVDVFVEELADAGAQLLDPGRR
jgi:hypothetical protein